MIDIIILTLLLVLIQIWLLPMLLNLKNYRPMGGMATCRGYRASQTSKPLKTLKPKVDKTVDTFHPLTVNRLLGRLVNTLDNKAIGAAVRG